MTKEPIEFYFEFGSPYGYFASLEIDRIGAEFGRQVIWKPFALGSAFKFTGSKPLREIPMRGDYMLQDLERIAKMSGYPYKLPEVFPAVMLAPPRAYYWLAESDPDLAKEFAQRCYHAYFAEGQDLRKPEGVAPIAAHMGVDPDLFVETVEDPEVKAKYKAVSDEAVTKGVFGSPFVIVEGEKFWGWDRLWMVHHFLEKGGY